ncbi:MAG: pyridoxamine 5'-phosphate oxidase family protein [Hyphomicrobiales bacterium]|jgi:PPOX class probable FMN-dependent enzyme|nr:pyridoxamine 5'-phosphate oxidase family protein [Hyphomicrobiales bacterium]
MADTITTIAELEAIYGQIVPAATIKVLDHVSEHYGQFIKAAPFVVLSTSGPEGLDCSPRGDPKGFVRIHDEKTLMLPDRRGNNRVDTLRNIVRDPRIALLFMIPGVGETMRVNGTAVLSTDLALRESFAIQDKVPACVIVIAVREIYTQCQKALARSKLWDPATQIPQSALPTVGTMLQAISKGNFDGKAYDDAYPERMKRTIY